MNNAKKPVNYRLIFKIISAVVSIMFFIPTMTVSCSGEDIGVSAGHTMIGYTTKIYGERERLSDPTIWPFFLLLFSVSMFVIACIKLRDVKTNALIIAAVSVIDIIGWIIFRNAVKKFAEENMCDFKTGFGYVLVMILLTLNILIAVALFANIFPDGSDGVNRAMISNSPGYVPAAGWTCPNCGKTMDDSGMFCKACGTPRPEPPQPVSQQLAFCPKCGKPVSPGTMF